jgi:hypothetical protein
MKREQAFRILQSNRAGLARYGVKSMALFGSTARDQAHLESDIDLLVEFDQPIGLFRFIDLKQYLETLFGCPVDLGTANSLKTQLRDEILRDAIYVA